MLLQPTSESSTVGGSFGRLEVVAHARVEQNDVGRDATECLIEGHAGVGKIQRHQERSVIEVLEAEPVAVQAEDARAGRDVLPNPGDVRRVWRRAGGGLLEAPERDAALDQYPDGQGGEQW